MKKNIILIIAMLCSLSACTDFLEAKPDKSLAIPSDKLQYLRSLADNTTVMNGYQPSTGDIASDDSYIPEALWPKLLQAQPTSANAYIWEKDMFNDIERTDWAVPYETIFYSNLMLEGLDDLKSQEKQPEWKDLRGTALFHRSYAFFNLLQSFSKAYHVNTARTDPGIVLKLSSDINEKLPRSSVQECYDRILTDLQAAIPLLREGTEYKTRPGRTAAYALLARIYLLMQRYDDALNYSEQALANHPTLLDYNELNSAAPYPISNTNPEIIFYSTMLGLSGMSATYGRVNPDLSGLYGESDLRKEVFFKTSNGELLFKGSYSSNIARFNGLASDELYLISAECFARLDKPDLAAERLNALLEKRWKTGTYVPIANLDASAILKVVLTERRKELCYRNRRWSDLKRLNLEAEFQKSIVRTINGNTYTLPPGDDRYAMPIPVKVIQFSGIAQN